MTRDEKATAVAALHDRFAKASVALLATNMGLSVEQANALRRSVKAAGGEYKVVKHTLTKRAVENTRYGRLGELLRGPRGLVFGYADPVAVAKALIDFAEQNAKLQIAGGAVEGQLIAADQVKTLATMPSLASLQARLVRQALAPGARVVAVATGPARRLAGAVAALVKKLEGTGVNP